MAEALEWLRKQGMFDFRLIFCHVAALASHTLTVHPSPPSHNLSRQASVWETRRSERVRGTYWPDHERVSLRTRILTRLKLCFVAIFKLTRRAQIRRRRHGRAQL